MPAKKIQKVCYNPYCSIKICASIVIYIIRNNGLTKNRKIYYVKNTGNKIILTLYFKELSLKLQQFITQECYRPGPTTQSVSLCNITEGVNRFVAEATLVLLLNCHRLPQGFLQQLAKLSYL